ITARTERGVIVGRPAMVSADPEEIIPGADLILMALPAFTHRDILSSILPFLDAGMVIGSLPARGGFDWECQQVLNNLWEKVPIFGFDTLPWACRIERFGSAVNILGTKREVDVAVWPPDQVGELAGTLADLLDLKVNPIHNFLSLTLGNPGQIIHPGIMFGIFHQWDGSLYQEAPLFYQNVDAQTADLLSEISAEIQDICQVLQAQLPDLDLTSVIPLHEWLRRAYANDVGDAGSLQSCFRTNRAYRGLRAPMRPVPGGLAPDFQARYLVEDVPYGLLVTRGIAEIAGVETPMIDEVIGWSQRCMGKEYLRGTPQLLDSSFQNDDSVIEREHSDRSNLNSLSLGAGKLCGRDLGETRAPQRYGINHIQQLIGGKF
ncbi:MAG: NAD/NADP octopine/nopaline dehydrogenase family protein, partial [Anaerolineales bacterium]|nr:NAD/NADP octopine/nopaline dehydrogenase family protein [Anaerolineales bacterium]